MEGERVDTEDDVELHRSGSVSLGDGARRSPPACRSLSSTASPYVARGGSRGGALRARRRRFWGLPLAKAAGEGAGGGGWGVGGSGAWHFFSLLQVVGGGRHALCRGMAGGEWGARHTCNMGGVTRGSWGNGEA